MTRLAGWRVLVPRDGAWGDAVAARLRAEGAEPVIAPLIAIRPPADPAALAAALERLAAGEYAGLAVTSAAAVDALGGVVIPANVHVGAVGSATAAALRDHGVPVALVPAVASGAALAEAWPAPSGRVLALRSAIAGPDLVDGLRTRRHEVDAVAAYATVDVPLPPEVAAEVVAGGIHAVLLTSGSVARSLARQAPGPRAVLAALGPNTARDAEAAGLRVDVVAAERSADSLVDALASLQEVRP